MSYTYKISANSKPKLEEFIEKHAVEHRIKRYRAAVITKAKLTKEDLAGMSVHGESEGRTKFHEWSFWTVSTLLEDLEKDQETFEKENTITVKKQIRACDKWTETLLDLEDAKKMVIKLAKRHERASRQVFKMHGRVPTRLKTVVESEGDIYDVTYIRETIMYLKRRGG